MQYDAHTGKSGITPINLTMTLESEQDFDLVCYLEDILAGRLIDGTALKDEKPIKELRTALARVRGMYDDFNH